MAFDGIMMFAVAKELARNIIGGKIEKIYQPRKEELVLYIHTAEGRKKLYISAYAGSARVNLTERNFENPAAPPNFCMLLRKHIQGAKITDISQYMSDRILEIFLETLDELSYSVGKKLVIEVMGKHSNITLVDVKTNRIVDSIRRIPFDQSRLRQLMPGFPFEYAPSQDKIPFKDVIYEDTLNFRDRDISACIGGISSRVGAQISKDGWEYIHRNLTDLIQAVDSGDLSPVIYLRDDGSPFDFTVVPLDFCEGSMKKISFETVSSMIDTYYESREESNRTSQMSRDLHRSVDQKLKKLYLKKQKLSEDLERARDSEHLRLYGEILTANLHGIRQGEKQVTLTNYYTNEPITIPLDVRYSPSKNAQQYFKAYSKSRTAIKEKGIQIEENDRNISYLESVLVNIENAEDASGLESIRDELVQGGYIRTRKNGIRKKTKYRPLEYISAKGYRVLIGRNNMENDYLTLKLAGKKDYWFHTKDIPGSHVICFTEGNEIDEETVIEVAKIAAKHSKAKDSSNVPVDYVPCRYVKKPNGAKPGMVIFTNNRTVYVTP